MKIFHLLLILGGSAERTVLKRVEFTDWAWRLAEARFGRLNTTQVKCPSELQPPCYEMFARMRSIDEHMDDSKPGGYQAHPAFHALLYYAVGEEKYSELRKHDYTNVRVVTSGDPKCGFAHPKMKELTGAVIGPSYTTITNEMIGVLSDNFKIEGSVTVAVEPIKGVSGSVTVGGKYFNDVKDATSSAVGNTFEPNTGEMCVPTSVLITRYCKNVPRIVHIAGSYGNKQPAIAIKHLKGSGKNTLVPLTESFRSFFEPIFGCISELNVRPDKAN